MDLYKVAKLVEMCGGIDSRKRLQKSIFLLQTLGLKFGAEYRLHYYGPYSDDVADAVGILDLDDVVREEASEGTFGRQFSYSITTEGAKRLRELEKTDKADACEEMKRLDDKIHELRKLNPWTLELAATVAYYHRRDLDWPDAREKAAEYKDVDPCHAVMEEAEKVAREFCASP